MIFGGIIQLLMSRQSQVYIRRPPKMLQNSFPGKKPVSTRHSEYAMFQECVQEHYGRVLGFTKPSETRFGGNLIAALRLLRLKAPLLMCIRKPQFVKRNKHRNIVIALQKECVWDFVFAVCRAFHPIMQLIRLCDSKVPNMHLLKYFVMQADCMLMEYGPKIETTFAAIPKNIRDIMGDAEDYNVGFEELPSDQLKTPRAKLMSKGNDDDEDSSIDESSDEEEEMEELKSDGEYQLMVEEDDWGDDLILTDPEGVSVTGRFLAAWKISRSDLLHVIARVAHILSPSPIVQAYVKNHMVAADMNAAEQLIVKWLLPKTVVGEERDRLEAEMILDFNNEFSEYFGLVFFFDVFSV